MVLQMLFQNKTEERQAAFLLYEKKVRQHTEKVFKKEYIDNKKYRGQDYVLDHRVSIKECFEHALPIEFAAHLCNLEIVPKKYNLEKGSRCSITIEDLIAEIAQRESDLELF